MWAFHTKKQRQHSTVLLLRMSEIKVARGPAENPLSAAARETFDVRSITPVVYDFVSFRTYGTIFRASLRKGFPAGPLGTTKHYRVQVSLTTSPLFYRYRLRNSRPMHNRKQARQPKEQGLFLTFIIGCL
jgi:hypothetical protein